MYFAAIIFEALYNLPNISTIYNYVYNNVCVFWLPVNTGKFIARRHET